MKQLYMVLLTLAFPLFYGIAAHAQDSTSSSTPPATTEAASPNDDRENFEATAFTGLAIDSFAAEELNQYINPNASSDIKERWIGGFDFDYRLSGNPAKHESQVWVYGETLHGVRSTDIDCSKSPGLTVCLEFNPNDPAARTLFILRNATSLEGFGGVRWEFKELRPAGESNAVLYLAAEAGFITVSGSGGDVLDNHQLAFGIRSINGRFSGSHLEAGFGKSDFFDIHRNRRLKIGALLSWMKNKQSVAYPFAEITIDSDLGQGADSIQSYYGVDFDLDQAFEKLFRAKSKTNSQK
jgi:hypothetical protein